jgi:hypothetical protein
LDSNEPVEIIENGTCLGPTTQSIFTKKSEKYAKAAFVKNSRIRGPVWDVFTDPYVVVYGTEIENQQFIRASQYAAEKIAKGGPCFADTDMPKELICSCNIILVGTAESNKWLAKIEHQLPVRIKNERVLAHNTSYIGQDVGFILIYPNPLNPEKYAAVFSGTSSAAILNTQKAYLHMRSIREADIGIFELTGDDGIQWHIMEKFNTVWDWHDEWDEVLAKTQKKHPKWQWQQLVAKAIKKQVGADVVICEDPFIFPQSTPIGQITYRDLFNTFRNDWFVTISLDGESLKKLLTTPLEYTKNNKTRDVIIDGLSLTGQQEFDEDKILTINELKSDQLYTLAIRDKNLNGERLGLHFDNYDITGQTFLLPLLKEYFSSNTCTDIDARLDSLKFRIF